MCYMLHVGVLGVVRAAALFYPRAQRSPGARRGPRPWATPRGEQHGLRSRRRRWGASIGPCVHSNVPQIEDAQRLPLSAI